MPKKTKSAKEKLEVLAEHLRAGWKQQYPVKEDTLGKIRELVRDQWEAEHAQDKEKERTKDQSQSKDKDHGHEH